MFSGIFVPYLQPYGGDYFSFVLIGIAFSGYQGVGLRSFSQAIRYEQVTGTLEIMLVTPTKISTILISSSLWRFLNTSINVLIYLLLGVILFGVNIASNANFFAVFIILILTIIALEMQIQYHFVQTIHSHRSGYYSVFLSLFQLFYFILISIQSRVYLRCR